MKNVRQTILFLSVSFILAACGTMPKKKLEALQRTPQDRIHSSAEEVLKKNPPTVSLTEKPVDFTFSDKSPVVKTKNGLSSAVTVNIKLKGEPYLTVWGYLHPVKFGNPGAVIPEVHLYDSNGNRTTILLVQIGEEPNCGLMRCMKMTYDLAKVKAGSYDLVLVAHVEDPEKPYRISNGNSVVVVGAAIIPTNYSFPMYADYFGDARISLEKQLPLKPHQEDVFTRTK